MPEHICVNGAASKRPDPWAADCPHCHQSMTFEPTTHHATDNQWEFAAECECGWFWTVLPVAAEDTAVLSIQTEAAP